MSIKQQKKYNQKVFVAMSGGVDSSVAALLLQKQGYDVVGVFMKYWMDSNEGGPAFVKTSAGEGNRCCSLEARRDAMKVCAHLGIPFLTWDFQKEFKKAVVNDFIKQYKNGLTPNPCVTCNKEIKLGLFFKRAMKEGAPACAGRRACQQAGIFVATGHYAKIRQANFGKLKVKSSKLKIEYKLLRAKDKKKDQSYFLYNLTQKQLPHILFPLGDLTKDEVRKIAAEANLPVATKQDSQEVCFVNKGELKEFLGKRIKLKEGDIVSPDGKILGKHNGAQFYTIGQRAPIGGTGPYYIIDKNVKKNQLIVANGDDKNLFIKEIAVRDVNWISGAAPEMPFECLVKTRYQQEAQKCVIKKFQASSFKLQVVFDNPQRGIAPGQSAVFYLPIKVQGAKEGGKSGEIIGGGIIV